MRSEADTDTTETTLERQREKLQINPPQRSLAQRACHLVSVPLAVESGHSVSTWEGALQAILREERWSLMVPCNQKTLKWTQKHRLSQQNQNTQYSFKRHHPSLPLSSRLSTWNLFFPLIPPTDQNIILIFK